MATFGDFESQRELSRGALITTFGAARRDELSREIYAVRLWRASSVMTREEAEEGLRRFEEQTRLLEVLTDSDAKQWPAVHESGRAEGGAYYVADRYEEHCGQYIRGRVVLPEEDLYRIVRLTVRGLRELRKAADRPHGNLKPTNVLVDVQGGRSRIALSDPKPDSALDEARDTRADLRALGELIHALVMHRIPGELSGHLVDAPAWGAIGRNGQAWRQLCDELLNPEPGAEPMTLDEVARRLDGLSKKTGGGRRRLIAAGALVAVVAIAVAAWFLKPPPPPPAEQVDIDRLLAVTNQESGLLYRLFEMKKSGEGAAGVPDGILNGIPVEIEGVHPAYMLAEINKSDLGGLKNPPRDVSHDEYLQQMRMTWLETLRAEGDEDEFNRRGGAALESLDGALSRLVEVRGTLVAKAGVFDGYVGWDRVAAAIRALETRLPPPDPASSADLDRWEEALKETGPVLAQLEHDFAAGRASVRGLLEGLAAHFEGLAEPVVIEAFLASAPRPEGEGDGDLAAELEEIRKLLDACTESLSQWQTILAATDADARDVRADPEIKADMKEPLTGAEKDRDERFAQWIRGGCRVLVSTDLKPRERTSLDGLNVEVVAAIQEARATKIDPVDYAAKTRKIAEGVHFDTDKLNTRYGAYWTQLELEQDAAVAKADVDALKRIRKLVTSVRNAFAKVDTQCETLPQTWASAAEWRAVDLELLKERRRKKCIEALEAYVVQVLKLADGGTLPDDYEPPAQTWAGYESWCDDVRQLSEDATSVWNRLELGYGLAEEAPASGMTVKQDAEAIAGEEASADVSGALAQVAQRVGLLETIAGTESMAKLRPYLQDARPDVAMALFTRADEQGDRDSLYAEIRRHALEAIASLPDERRKVLADRIRAAVLARWRAWELQEPGDAYARFQAALAMLEDLELTEQDVTADSPKLGAKFHLHRLFEARAGIGRREHDRAVAEVVKTLAALPDDPAVRGVIGPLVEIRDQEGPRGVDPRDLAPVGSNNVEFLESQSHPDGDYIVFRLRGASRQLTFRFVEPAFGQAAYVCVDECPVWLFSALVGQTALDNKMDEPAHGGIETWRYARRRYEPASAWWPRFVAPKYWDGRAPAGPRPDHPMQSVTPMAAAYAASVTGCRLPTIPELKAAAAQEPGPPNLGGRTFRTFWMHVITNRRALNANDWPPPDNDALWATSKRANPDPPDHDDGERWLRTTNLKATKFRNVIGNVGELAWETATDIQEPTKPQGLTNTARLKAVGGSAFTMDRNACWTPSRVRPNSVWPDVGFRLAFSVEGKASQGPDLVKALNDIVPAELFAKLSE